MEHSQDNSISAQINRLLLEGYTRRQLLEKGFHPRTVDAAIKKFKEQWLGVDKKAMEGIADFLDSTVMGRYVADLATILRRLAPQYGISDKQLLKLRHLMAAVAEEMRKKGWRYGN